MLTAWAFFAILYTTQAFRDIPTASRWKHSAPSTTERTTQPPRQLSMQGNNDSEAFTARVPSKPTGPSRQSIRDILNFHHGTLASRAPTYGSVPAFGWHVTVYNKNDNYEQICGGSLVKKDTAISAAHCFWDEAGLMPAELFAVAVGQSHRRWKESIRYKSNVSEIIVPPRFLGGQTNFQDDIAVVRLETPVDYKFGVRPVCVDFDLEKERSHLLPHFGALITGFGLTEENGSPSEQLNYQVLPYVDIQACIAASDPGFLKYLTSDKICAGDQKTGRALCRGDSGGGLVFSDGVDVTAVIYLRGVASTAPRNNNACNAHAIATFTHLSKHRTFLRDHIPGLEAECKTFYGEQLEPKDVPVNEKANKTVVSNNAGNTEPQTVTSVVGTQLPNTGVPSTNTASKNKVQCPGGVSNNDRAQTASAQPSANGKDAAVFVNELMRNPNTNIFFFTGPVVDPSRFYNQGSVAPTPSSVEGRAEQPTNIYVIIQN